MVLVLVMIFDFGVDGVDGFGVDGFGVDGFGIDGFDFFTW